MNKIKNFSRPMNFCALSPNFDENQVAVCVPLSEDGCQEVYLHNFENDKTYKYQYQNDKEQITQVYSHVVNGEDCFFIVGHKIYLFKFNRHFELMMINTYKGKQTPLAHFTQMDICDSKIIAGILDGSICVLDLEGKAITQFALLKGSSVISVKFRNENTAIALNENSLITMVDLNQKHSHLIFNIENQIHFDEVVAHTLNPNQFFAFSYRSQHVYLFDVRNGIEPVAITDYGSGDIQVLKAKKDFMMSSSDQGIILRYGHDQSKSQFNVDGIHIDESEEPIYDIDFSKQYFAYLIKHKLNVIPHYSFCKPQYLN